MSDAAPIHLDRGQAGGLDELTGAAPAFLNAIVEGPPGDGPRAIRTRPGIAAWDAFPATFSSASPVVAMAELNSRILYLTDDGSSVRKAFGLAGSTVIDMSAALGTSLITGAESLIVRSWRDFAFACGGGDVQLLSYGLASSRLSGAPPHARDLAIIAQRLVLVAPDRSGLFYWSSLPGEADTGSTWDTLLDFREAEARPDALVGCAATSRELFMFGSETTQLFYPDPSEVFSPGPALEIGCLSKRSVIRVDTQMAWLDDKKRIVMSDGRGLTVISDQGIAKTLKAIATASDCWGFRCVIGSHDLLAWVFPTDGRTFAYDLVSQTWSEWRRYADGRWQAWAPTAYLWSPAYGKHLVGMPDGSVAELTLDAYTDLGDPLAWVCRTGFTEVSRRRHCVDARFIVRRGSATSSNSKVAVRWRDDLGAFCPPIEFPVGVPGDYEADISVSPAGEPYRRRQWELSGSGADAYLIAGGKETFEEAEF